MPSQSDWLAAFEKSQPAAGAGEDGDADGGVDRARELAAAGPLQVGEGQGDDQERLDALPQRDGESLPHGSVTLPRPPLDSRRGDEENTATETQSQSRTTMEKRELQIFRKYLERRGLKLTAERQALFDELFARHEHVEADELLVRLRAKHKKISRATIYRTLELMVDSGIVGRLRIGEAGLPLRAAARGRPPRPPDLRQLREGHRVLRAADRGAAGRGGSAARLRAAVAHAPDAGHLPRVPSARQVSGVRARPPRTRAAPSEAAPSLSLPDSRE